jgi:hypothetical protein
MQKITFKEAKEKFSKRAFWGCLLALAVCWFMKLFGITHFNLDLENKFFNQVNDFMNNYSLTNIYYTITLSIQVYLLYCIVNRTKGKKAMLYCLMLVPFNVLVRVMTSKYELQLGNWAIWIEFVYMILVTSRFKYKKFPRAIFVNLFIILYQALSVMLRDYQIRSHQYGFLASQILSIDLYILLILHREVSFMNDGTWFIFGFTAWIYAVAGFFVGLFTGHPIKKAKEYYAKGKAKEDARKTEKTIKKVKAK